jgi:uroporphyrin-III C-methyltransferase
VFGRGGEELAFLARHGVACELVPGLTAGTAVPAALGIPLTHRGLARSVTFLGGHTADGGEPDWTGVARADATLVVYMGFAQLPRIVERLLDAGLAARTPAAVIAAGTRAGQRHVVAPLGALVARVRDAQLYAPALIVVGEVVGLADERSWAAGVPIEGATDATREVG